VAVACLWGSQAWALGLGRLTVQSALGENLRAEIDVTSITPEEASSLRVRVATPEVYRASGVDYNTVLTGTSVQLVQRNGRSVLQVSSDRAVLEPFFDLIVEASWSSGRLVREFTMLFDPPQSRTAAPAPTSTMPVITAAPPTPSVPPAAPAVAAPAPAAEPAASPGVAPALTTPAPAPSPAATTQPVPAREAAAPRSAAAASATDSVRVNRGEALSRIAARTQLPGVSLDQMLVSLYRANPQAFLGDNMNRLKAGAVLSLPTPEEASSLSPQEAREIIVAQSADFAAYRQRLAQGAAAVPTEASGRQATGQVQAQVEDRKLGGTGAPERLILSQGGVKPDAPEAKLSKEAERKEASTRIAELSKTVDDLKKLQKDTAAAPPPAAPGPAPAVVPAAPPPAPAPALPTPTIAAAPPVVPASAGSARTRCSFTRGAAASCRRWRCRGACGPPGGSNTTRL